MSAFEIGEKVAAVYGRASQGAIDADPLNALWGYLCHSPDLKTPADRAKAAVDSMLMDAEMYDTPYPLDDDEPSPITKSVYHACQAWLREAASAYHENPADVLAGAESRLAQ